jgi:DNA-binding beta-propeller fold protein YncE
MGGKQKPTQPLKTLGLGRQPTGIALDARAGRAAVINTGDGSVSFVDTRDGSVVMTVHLRHGLPLAVAMDGRTGHTFVAGAGQGARPLTRMPAPSVSWIHAAAVSCAVSRSPASCGGSPPTKGPGACSS